MSAYFTTPINFETSLREWREHYQRKSFTLARATMMECTEAFPRRPESWFLLGLTELAARDVSNANEHFRAVLTLLEEDSFERSGFFTTHEPAIRGLTPWILEGLDNRSLFAAPYDPWLWLTNWEEVVKMRATAAGALRFQPLGRTTPLMGFSDGVPLMAAAPRLMDQLRVEPVHVDTMRGLLGRDADLVIDPIRIRVIDDSVVIEKPLLRAADGTYKPLLTADLERARVESRRENRSQATPASTFNVPLPQLEPFEIPAIPALPAVLFSRPDFPQMAPLSLESLPGATSVDMRLPAMALPTLPPTMEMLGYNLPPAASPVGAISASTAAPSLPQTDLPKPPSAAYHYQPTPHTPAPAYKTTSTAAVQPPPSPQPPVQSAPPKPAPPTILASELTLSIEEEDALEASPLGDLIPTPKPAVSPPAADSAPDSARDPWSKWEGEIDTLLQQGKIIEAIRRVDEAVGKYPQSARLEQFRGTILERVGRFEDATRSFVQAYRKARESGADQRAKEALDHANRIARRTPKLMMETGALLASLGVGGASVLLLSNAADRFRKEGDAGNLAKAVALLRKHSAVTPDKVERAQNLESEYSQMAGSLRSALQNPQPSVLPASPQPTARTSPPRAPVAPRIGGDPSRISTHSSAPKRPVGKQQDQSVPESFGGAFLSLSIIILAFTVISGLVWPPVLGLILTMIVGPVMLSKAPSAANRVRLMIARVVFLFAFLWAIIF